ncbi:hypothetical protein HZH66_010119 [Vespula vulgaris]|uniref:Uncharacterized protein n=1 Tax=Vespula vulgaris TaxID=7454 RepID=A0A834MXQ1_VESVU|nr:hypothetical protein HZH66_010119 [Vespula vulgaris]
MGALARHQSAIIGRQVVRGSIFRRTPAKPYGRPPAEGTTSAVRPMGAKGRPLNVTRATNYCAIPGVTIKGDHEAQNFHWQYSSKLDEYVGTFRVSTLCYPSPHHSILLTRSSLSGWDTSAFPIVLPRYASTRYARATSRRALDNAIVAAGWHNSGSIINETSATNLEQAIALHPKMLIKWLLDSNSASQQDHENSYYRLDYYNLPKISNCIISPFLVYPEVKQTHESSQTRAI